MLLQTNDVELPRGRIETEPAAVLEQVVQGEIERTEISISRATRQIQCVECVMVIRITLRGAVLTGAGLEWLVRDPGDNVWRMGQVSYLVERGEIVGVADLWEAGRDGARGAIVSPPPVPAQRLPLSLSLPPGEGDQDCQRMLKEGVKPNQ